jgi:hypothetical protein
MNIRIGKQKKEFFEAMKSVLKGENDHLIGGVKF